MSKKTEPTREDALQHLMSILAIALHAELSTSTVSAATWAKKAGVKKRVIRRLLAGDPRAADVVTMETIAALLHVLDLRISINIRPRDEPNF